MAWIPIRYPHAIYDHDEQRWVSDAEVAEVAFTAFTGRRHAEHITARGDRAPGSPAQPDPPTTGQSKLFAPYRYHAVCTDNPQPMLDAQATHRHHAIVEQVIADLKESALAYLPSGYANANAAWLVCAAIAHNLTEPPARWPLAFTPAPEPATIRTQLINTPARLAHSAHRLVLHLRGLLPVPRRNTASAKRFLAKTLRSTAHAGPPRVINADKNPALAAAIVELKADGRCATSVRHR